ncbi:MAG: phosphopantetheine-binding protein [Rhodoglobus sp.]
MVEDKTAAAVRRAWKIVLGQAPADSEDNFFEAGGDSLSALELITIVAGELGVTIPMAALYSTPTFGELVRLVESSASDDVPTAHHVTGRSIVRLRRGGAGRLWCFLPPLSGAVTRYAAMPRFLPSNDAIWAMETPAELSQGGMRHLIEGLAQLFTEQDISLFQTIVFSGYSLGGVFAHELAQSVAVRLSGAKAPVIAAALLDPPDPEKFRPSLADAFDIFVRVGWRIPEPSQTFRHSDGQPDLRQVAAAARDAGTLAATAPDREISDAWTVYASNANILDGHVIGRGVPATFLLQCDPTSKLDASHWVSDSVATGAWGAAVRPSHTSVLAVDHFRLLEPPNDSVVGKWLTATAEKLSPAAVDAP